MGYGERSAIVAQHRIEDLSHGQQGAVDAAFAYPNDSLELVRRVADKDDCSLTSGGSDLAHRDGGDVGPGIEHPRGQVVRSDPGQAEG